MDFRESEEIAAFRDTVRTFVRRECPPEKIRQWDKEDRIPKEIGARMGALGICGLCVFLVMRARAYNSTVYPPLIERWRRSFLCRRCGDIFATS